jgi:hypothetical protein
MKVFTPSPALLSPSILSSNSSQNSNKPINASGTVAHTNPDQPTPKKGPTTKNGHKQTNPDTKMMNACPKPETIPNTESPIPVTQQHPGFFPGHVVYNTPGITLHNPWVEQDDLSQSIPMDTTENATSIIASSDAIADSDICRVTDTDITMTPETSVEFITHTTFSPLPKVQTTDDAATNSSTSQPVDMDQDGFSSDTSTTSSLNERIASFKWKNKKNRKSRRALNSLHTESVAASRHAPPTSSQNTPVDDSEKATFDAYIHPSLAPGEWIVDKITYYNVVMTAYDHFIDARSEKINGESYLLVSFRSHCGLMNALKDHNERFPEAKLTAKKYYTYGRRPISSADFKLHNVPESATARQIHNAIKQVDTSADVRIRHRDKKGDVTFRVLDYGKTHKFANTWSVVLGDTVIRLTPGHFDSLKMQLRNKWVARFSGFRPTTTLAEAHQVLAPQGALDLYRRAPEHNDLHIYAVFKTELDRNNACLGQYSFKSMRILGAPKGMSWDDWKVKCSPPKPTKTMLNGPNPPTTGIETKLDTDDQVKPSSSSTSMEPKIIQKASTTKTSHKKKTQSAPTPRNSSVATGTNRIPLGNRSNRLDYRVLDPDLDLTNTQPPPTNGSGNVKSKGSRKGKKKEEHVFFAQVHQALKEEEFSPDIYEELHDGYDDYITRNHWVEASASTQV